MKKKASKQTSLVPLGDSHTPVQRVEGKIYMLSETNATNDGAPFKIEWSSELLHGFVERPAGSASPTFSFLESVNVKLKKGAS